MNISSLRFLVFATLLAIVNMVPTVSSAQCPSARTGLGPVIYSNGVMFRVWAPNAQSVNVAGTFNNWNATSHPLCSEGNGYWSADVSGVTNKTQYKYAIRHAGVTHWRRDPRGRAVVNSVGNSIIDDAAAYTWGDAASTLPFWNEMIIYQLHIGTFNDPSPSNNVPANFQDAAARLDHIAELGANMIKLLPVNEFPGDYSWGYNPSEVFSVESVYGGVAGLRHFVNEAHRRNIGVILDVVYNHLGPNDLQSLWQFDGWAVTNTAGGIYFYQDWRNYTPWGHTRPDYGRAEVRRLFTDNILMWLDECHVDGFRWDATAFIRNVYGNNNDPANDLADGWGMMMDANNRLDQAAPWAISIAEDMRGNPFITKTTGEGGAGFDSQWDPDFVHPIRAAIIESSDANRNMWSVHSAITRKENSDAFRRVIYTESHDEVANGKKRVASEIDVANPGSYWARKRSTLGAAVLLTSPGIPMVFMGQEFLEDDWFSDTNPVDWQKKTTFNGIFQLYKDITLLRKNGTGATRGLAGQHINAFHVNDLNKVIAYHRWSEGGVGDDVVVIANFANSTWTPSSNYRIGFPRAGAWYPVFNSDSTRYGADFSNVGGQTIYTENVAWNNLPFSANISVGPYSVVVLSQATGAIIDTPPTVGLTYPQVNGQVLTGTVTLAASASDNRSVNRVEFFVNSTRTGTDSNAPYSVVWDTRSISNGSHAVRAVAFDDAGQSATDTVSVVVSNINRAPTVTFTSPTNGARVSGSVNVAATATDDVSVASVQFFVNGISVTNDTAAPYGFTWNSASVSNGSHILQAVARDNTGQTGQQSISVTVSNSLFLSAYQTMSVAGNFSGSSWNATTNLMRLISNYTWQGTFTVNNTKTTEFKFAANGAYTFNWGDNSQPNRKVPINDVADASGANIKIDPRLSGSYRFTFNEQTRHYSVIKP